MADKKYHLALMVLKIDGANVKFQPIVCADNDPAHDALWGHDNYGRANHCGFRVKNGAKIYGFIINDQFVPL